MIDEQRQWMERCGGTRAGYILNYGFDSDPNKYGDGGNAIYDADRSQLERLRKQYKECK